jgi:hypothetical protein
MCLLCPVHDCCTLDDYLECRKWATFSMMLLPYSATAELAVGPLCRATLCALLPWAPRTFLLLVQMHIGIREEKENDRLWTPGEERSFYSRDGWKNTTRTSTSPKAWDLAFHQRIFKTYHSKIGALVLDFLMFVDLILDKHKENVNLL